MTTYFAQRNNEALQEEAVEYFETAEIVQVEYGPPPTEDSITSSDPGDPQGQANPGGGVEEPRFVFVEGDPERGQVCYNGEIFFPGGPSSEFTLRTSLWLLREGRAMWWAKDGDTPSFENRKEDVSYSDVWLW